MASVTYDHVYKRFGDVTAVNDLAITVEDKEFLVLVALPGGAGTASEVALALRYRRPVIAYLDDPDEIDGLPAEAIVESDFAAVQDFVREHIRR